MDLSKIKMELKNLSERLNMESVIYGSSVLILTSLTYIIYKFFSFGKSKVTERQKPKKVKQKETKKKSDLEHSPSKSKSNLVPESKKTKPNSTRKLASAAETVVRNSEPISKTPLINVVSNAFEEEDSGEWMQVTGRKTEVVKSKELPQFDPQPVVMKSKKVAALPDILAKPKEPIKQKDKSPTNTVTSKKPVDKISDSNARKSEPVKAKPTKVEVPSVNKSEPLVTSKPAKMSEKLTAPSDIVMEGEWEEATSSKNKKRRARKD